MSEELVTDAPAALAQASKAVPCLSVPRHAFASREQFKQLMSAGSPCCEAHSQPAQRWG